MADSVRAASQFPGASCGPRGVRILFRLALLICLSVFCIRGSPIAASADQEEGLQSERRVYSEEQKARAEADKKAVMENGAVALTESTYSDFMAAHPLVFVLFYAPWCYWSRAALPEFDAAAKLLSHHDPPVIAARVDCTVNEEVCNLEYIREYPTLRLYVEGVGHLYEGRRFRTHIVHWVDLKVDRDKKLVSAGHLDELVSHSSSDGSNGGGHVVVVGAFPADYNRGSFQAVARVFGEEVLFGDTTDPILIGRLKTVHILPKLSADQRGSMDVEKELTAPFVVVFAPHKGESAVHLYQGQVAEVNELRTFVRQWLFPAVSLFDTDSIGNHFFKDPRPKLVLLLNSKEHADLLNEAESADPKHPWLSVFRSVAEKHRGAIAATVSGNSKPFERQLFNILGMEDEPLPQIRIMFANHNSDGRHHPAHKFRPASPLPPLSEGREKLETAINDFVSSVISRQLPPYFRSEIPPETPEPRGRVRTIVGSTFTAEIAREPNVLVEFYAPWCGFCRKMEPAYKELAKRLAGVSGIVIARIDATRNEVDGVQISGYPTVYLYRRGEGEPLLYTGDRSTRDLLKWLSVRVKDASPFDADELMARDISSTNDNVGSVLEEL